MHLKTVTAKTEEKSGLPFAVLQPDNPQPVIVPEKPLRRGDQCPRCGADGLDYNGLLELTCDRCGFALSGGAGCT